MGGGKRESISVQSSTGKDILMSTETREVGRGMLDAVHASEVTKLIDQSVARAPEKGFAIEPPRTVQKTLNIWQLFSISKRRKTERFVQA